MTDSNHNAFVSLRTLLVRVGSSESFPAALGGEVVHRLTLTEAGEGGLGLEPGAIGRSHGLIEGLGDLLADHAVEAVSLPGGVDADDDQRALVAAAVAASSLHRVLVSVDGGAPAPAAEAYRAHRRAARARSGDDARTVTAVISAWNKREDVRANLLGIRAQTRPFDDVVVVDNHSSDGTPEMIAEHFPEVRLIRMPNSAYGACETFNVGFSSVNTPLLAILDDDVVLPPDWLLKTTTRLLQEPDSTAIISTKVVEPGTPESYLNSEAVNSERYMSTFRGCGSLARTEPLRECGFYDEHLFIYGNERDLTCRLLNKGLRVLQFPGAETFHRQPFGVQMGKRSLYFHARNAWITMFKYAPVGDLIRMPWLVLTKVLLRGSKKEAEGAVTDATGTIGIGAAVRETKGALWILTKASFGVLASMPHILRHRKAVTHEDFELPLS